MMSITFNYPYMLYIMIPLLLLFVLPFVIFVKRKKANKIISLVLHIIISALIAVSLADLKTTNLVIDSSVYMLCDVSSSTLKSREKMDAYIEEYKSKISVNTRLAVICYGKNQEELVPLGEELKSVSLSNVDISSSNLEEALRFTVLKMKEDTKNHIVILSDGLEVDGDALTYSKEIPLETRIDAVYFESKFNDEDYEMMLEALDGSKSTYLGINEKINVNVKSSYSDDATIKFYCDDTLLKEETKKINKGTNAFTYNTLTDNKGNHVYKVELINNKDYLKENNVVYFRQEVIEKPNILYVYKDEDNALNLPSSLSANANFTRVPDTRIRDTSVNYLCKFDEVILNNVDLNYVTDGENFARSLSIYVNEYGKSLVTMGGRNTYLDGGFYSSEIGNMLPVNINPSDTKNNTAVMILIDNSGSMGSALTNAKKGAINCLNLLNENDYFGVVSFASETSVVFPMARPTATNKAKMTEAINKIPGGDGTVMKPGLELAFEQLRRIDSNNKMILLLSDGMPDDGPASKEMAEKIAMTNIMVSTISIGSSNVDIMRQIAEAGKGHYVAATDSKSIEQAMINEVTDLIMETKIEKNSKVNVNISKSPLLDGISNIPNIEGFNFSKIKIGAENILSTNVTLDNGIEVENAPILARWNYGKGKVVSLLTDTTYIWTNSWNNDVYPKLLKNIVFSSLPKEHSNDDVIFDYKMNGYTGELNINFSDFNVYDQVSFNVTSPSGEVKEYNAILAKGKYYSRIETNENGIYDIKIVRKNNKNLTVQSYSYHAVKDYSKEYDDFKESDNLLLWQIVENRGVLSNKVDDIVYLEQEDKIVEKHYGIYFVIAALVLYIIDIIIRKITIRDILNIGKIFKKKN